MNNQAEWIGFGDSWIFINKMCNIQERRDIDLDRKQKRVLPFISDLELVEFYNYKAKKQSIGWKVFHYCTSRLTKNIVSLSLYHQFLSTKNKSY